MPDDMFFTQDERSLRRGKRREKRTEICRPCVIQTRDGVLQRAEGVVLDMNPYGMRIRMLDSLPVGSTVSIQLMRDDTFDEPFSRPLEGAIVRNESSAEGFIDHGVRLEEPLMVEPQRRAVPRRAFQPLDTKRTTAGMHTIDFTIGDAPLGRGRQ